MLHGSWLLTMFFTQWEGFFTFILVSHSFVTFCRCRFLFTLILLDILQIVFQDACIHPQHRPFHRTLFSVLFVDFCWFTSNAIISKRALVSLHNCTSVCSFYSTNLMHSSLLLLSISALLMIALALLLPDNSVYLWWIWMWMNVVVWDREREREAILLVHIHCFHKDLYVFQYKCMNSCIWMLWKNINCIRERSGSHSPLIYNEFEWNCKLFSLYLYVSLHSNANLCSFIRIELSLNVFTCVWIGSFALVCSFIAFVCESIALHCFPKHLCEIQCICYAFSITLSISLSISLSIYPSL